MIQRPTSGNQSSRTRRCRRVGSNHGILRFCWQVVISRHGTRHSLHARPLRFDRMGARRSHEGTAGVCLAGCRAVRHHSYCAVAVSRAVLSLATV
mgnify:CR=1 FL=1